MLTVAMIHLKSSPKISSEARPHVLQGSIDQVAQVAHIHWVQPKVLDLKQVDGMRNRLKDWDAGVNQLGHWIEGVGKDVWAA